MIKLKHAVERQNRAIVENAREPLCLRMGIQEASDDVNESERQVIWAMQETYGSAYLGCIQPNPVTQKIGLVKYEGQELHNFCCDFCIPHYNVDLERMIEQWNACGDPRFLSAIYTLISDLGGIVLVWS